MGAFFSCGRGSNASRFKARSQPVIERLEKRRLKFADEGKVHARNAQMFRREAVKMYNGDNLFQGRSYALQALEQEALASKYMDIIAAIISAKGHISRLGLQYDAFENFESTADDLKKIGAIKEKYDADHEKQDDEGKTLTTEERISFATEAFKKFEQIEHDIDHTIFEIQAKPAVINAEYDEQTIDKLIGEWKITKKTDEPKFDFDTSPRQLAMMDDTDTEL